jgi:hypothetical protein
MTAYRLYRGALAGRVSRSERHRISAAGAVLRAERYGGFSNRSVLLSVEAKADAKDGSWRKAAVHAQQHLVVHKHELEMPAIRIIRVELLCRVENWFVWILQRPASLRLVAIAGESRTRGFQGR